MTTFPQTIPQSILRKLRLILLRRLIDPIGASMTCPTRAEWYSAETLPEGSVAGNQPPVGGYAAGKENRMFQNERIDERVKMVKAMEFIARQTNNEELFDAWLTVGVADGDIPYGDLSVTADDKYTLYDYVEDDEAFSDLMYAFLSLMTHAKNDSGLYCGGVVSKTTPVSGSFARVKWVNEDLEEALTNSNVAPTVENVAALRHEVIHSHGMNLQEVQIEAGWDFIHGKIASMLQDGTLTR